MYPLLSDSVNYFYNSRSYSRIQDFTVYLLLDFGSGGGACPLRTRAGSAIIGG